MENFTVDTQWWELQVIGAPILEELLAWELQAMGVQGTASQIKDGQLYLCGYFSLLQVVGTDLEAMGQRLRSAAADMEAGTVAVTWRVIEEEDWASSWKEYWHPTNIGDRLLINPAWLPMPKETDRIVIQLNPGVAFGTGAHATTQLCLTALEAQFREPVSHPYLIADIGCGTGILAIAALLLGADQAYAVDTDPLAVQSAQECRDLNSIDASRMQVSQGSIEEVIAQVPTPADGFCCNILAHVIIELIPQMTHLTQSNGWGILSGILQKQVPEVEQALTTHGWIIQQSWQQEDWACLKIVQKE